MFYHSKQKGRLLMDENIKIESIEDWPEDDKKIINEGRVLIHLHKKIELQSELISSRYGVSARQFDVLDILFNYPDKMSTPAQLADEVHLTRSTMTGTLDGLEKKGFILRESHPNDRRSMLIKLTEEGLNFCKEKMPERYTNILRVMKSMSTDDRDHLRRIYTKLLTIMKELLTA